MKVIESSLRQDKHVVLEKCHTIQASFEACLSSDIFEACLLMSTCNLLEMVVMLALCKLRLFSFS